MNYLDCPIQWPPESSYKDINSHVDNELHIEYYQSLYLPNTISSALDFLNYLESRDVEFEQLKYLYLPLLDLERKYRLTLTPIILNNSFDDTSLPQGIRDRLEFNILKAAFDRRVVEQRVFIKNLELTEKLLQVSILLFLLSKASVQSEDTKPRKRKRKAKELTNDYDSIHERLEFAVDRLVLWQTLNNTPLLETDKDKQEKKPKADEIQKFYKHTVDSKFRKKLPNVCKAMRSKCFTDESRDDNVDLPPPLLPTPSNNASITKTRSTTPQVEELERESSVASVDLERKGSLLDRELSLQRGRSLSRQPSSSLKMFANRVVGVSRKSTAVKDKKEMSSKVATNAFEALSGEPSASETQNTTRIEKKSTLVAATPAKKEKHIQVTNSSKAILVADSPVKAPVFGTTMAASDEDFQEDDIIPDTPQKKHKSNDKPQGKRMLLSELNKLTE
ncbi:hypothetical protein E3Q11_03321 [Wallemia mellicola]|nr:hypothetical protein E3Q11_03321 [Wallemia mellicola]